jgi:MFS family permease
MQWAVAYAAMLSTTLLFAIDNTIVANIQPSIINDFGHLELMSWIGTGFALGTMFILLWGKVYGVFNIKWVYIFNIFLFEAGSAVCGAAPNIEALIIGRVIAGIGGSGMYSGTLTYVSVLTNQQEKPAYLAGSTVVWGIGSVLGPVVGLGFSVVTLPTMLIISQVGGAFAASSATWRWVCAFIPVFKRYAHLRFRDSISTYPLAPSLHRPTFSSSLTSTLALQKALPRSYA